MDCTPQGLATAASCYLCTIPPGLVGPAQVMLLAQIRAALVPGTSTDPLVIAQQASCYDCNYLNYQAAIVMLECDIATASGA
jgi:hypothetical protein